MIYVGLTSNKGNEDLPFSFDFEEQTTLSILGPIENSDIIDQENSKIILGDPERPSFKLSLKSESVENIDFVLIPDLAFKVLKSRHKCVNDIQRFGIKVSNSIYQVEVFLKTVKIGYTINNSVEIGLMNVSRKDTIGEVKRKFSTIKNLSKNSKA